MKTSSLIILHKKTPQFLEEFCVGLLGLEPRKTAPKTVVLPLHHRPIPLLLSECKFSTIFSFYKFLFLFIKKLLNTYLDFLKNTNNLHIRSDCFLEIFVTARAVT